MNIVLCGYKASGKTTIGQAYAAKYGCDFIDTDALIIENFKMIAGDEFSIGEVHEAVGEAEFRKLEAKAVKIISKAADSIIATGGGGVMDSVNVKHLKSLGRLIYLHVDRQVLYERLSKNANFPSFINIKNKEDNLEEYLSSRDDVYQKVSDCVINTNGKTIEEIMSLINQYRCNNGK